MNQNAKKQRKPAAEKPAANKAAAAGPKQPPKKEGITARRRESRKQRKLKKIKINSERIFETRTKLHAGDGEARAQVEKIVATLTARNTKSKRGHRKLNMYKNLLSGKFSLEKNTGSRKKGANKKPAKK